ncbi:hypothetical protein DFQ45_10781 [Thiopseudomonas denitrificans]|uniref:Uncharacterized protein n=1 Tax=Thiopseudomonas denitrificans TaxID=1501432 RepID=A0A4R6TZZ2_9GAMM|nr:hypothetical protein DFQ45_10781 [Thiopseudomonas denitrificans]
MELMIFAYSRHAERNRWRRYAIHQHQPSATSAAA